MPVYEYVCPTCGYREDVVCSVAEYADLTYYPVCTCTDPPTPLNRKFSFAASEVFEPHWNMAAGKFVSSRRELDDHYKAVNDANAARGRPSNLQAVDRGEVTAADLGVSEILPERRISESEI